LIVFVSGIAEKEPGVALEGMCEERERSIGSPFDQRPRSVLRRRAHISRSLLASSLSEKNRERERERERETR